MYANNSNSSQNRGLNIYINKAKKNGQNQIRSYSANDKD